jgi:hypothetical protein
MIMSDTPRKTSRKIPAKSAKDKSVSKSTSVKHKHAQLVRDSFTMPEDEYRLLADAKKACLEAGFEIKKSELIRIGIALMYDLSTSRIKKAQKALQPVKTGRPKKHK